MKILLGREISLKLKYNEWLRELEREKREIAGRGKESACALAALCVSISIYDSL
jgi:hypothetical protein